MLDGVLLLLPTHSLFVVHYFGYCQRDGRLLARFIWIHRLIEVEKTKRRGKTRRKQLDNKTVLVPSYITESIYEIN